MLYFVLFQYKMSHFSRLWSICTNILYLLLEGTRESNSSSKSSTNQTYKFTLVKNCNCMIFINSKSRFLPLHYPEYPERQFLQNPLFKTKTIIRFNLIVIFCFVFEVLFQLVVPKKYVYQLPITKSYSLSQKIIGDKDALPLEPNINFFGTLYLYLNRVFCN